MNRTVKRAAIAGAGLLLSAAATGCANTQSRALPFNDPTPTASASAGAASSHPDKVVQQVPGYGTGVLSPNEFDALWIDVDGGRRVECIRYTGSREGGLSCDWNHPQPINGPATTPAK